MDCPYISSPFYPYFLLILLEDMETSHEGFDDKVLAGLSPSRMALPTACLSCSCRNETHMHMTLIHKNAWI
jgi:hypothetical protein